MTDTTEYLENEIETHRANVEHTLDKLKGRMSVEQVVDDIGQFVGLEDVRGTLRTAGRQVRDNPVALGLIGVGLGWLLLGRSATSRQQSDAPMPQRRGETGTSHSPYSGAWNATADAHARSGDAGDVAGRVSDAASHAGAAISDAATGVADRIGDAASAVKARVGNAASAVRHGAAEAVDRVQSTIHAPRQSGADLLRPVTDQIARHPLLIGAATLVAGAVIASAMPRTRTEDRLLGDHRDHLLDEAKTATLALRDRAADAAKSTYVAAVRAADAEGLLPDADTTLASKIETVAGAAIEEVRNQLDPVLHGTQTPDDQPLSVGAAISAKDAKARK